MSSWARKIFPLVILFAAPLARATDYVWQPLLKNHFDDGSRAYFWDSPSAWLSKDGKHGIPAGKDDTGIIPDGTFCEVTGDLGTPESRPTIIVNPGGRLYLTTNTNTPVTLHGGTLDPNWRHTSFGGDLSVTADSTILVNDIGDFHLLGKLILPKALTLRLDGPQQIRSNGAADCQGKLLVVRGDILLYDPRSENNLGSARVELTDGTALNFSEPWQAPPMQWVVTNDITGPGSLGIGDGSSNKTLTLVGNQLRPMKGTLAVHAGQTLFTTAGNRRARLFIDIHGAGGDIDAGQIAFMGVITDSLDNADLQIEIDPHIAPADLKDAVFKIITVESAVPTGAGRKPFHSITIRRGGVEVKAEVHWAADQFNAASWLELSHIMLPEGNP